RNEHVIEGHAKNLRFRASACGLGLAESRRALSRKRQIRSLPSRDGAAVLSEVAGQELGVDLEVESILLQAGHFEIDIDVVAVLAHPAAGAGDDLGLGRDQKAILALAQRLAQGLLEH